MDIMNMDVNTLVVWLILGAVAGWLAGQVIKGKGIGLLGNIVIGILGSFVGGWLAPKLGIVGATTGGLSIPSILTAAGGAVVLLFIVSIFKKAT